MTDSLPWISGVLILFVLVGVVWINRRRMKSEVARMRGSNPDFQALAAELRRTNDILEKTLQTHDARLSRLEAEADSSTTKARPDVSRSLN